MTALSDLFEDFPGSVPTTTTGVSETLPEMPDEVSLLASYDAREGAAPLTADQQLILDLARRRLRAACIIKKALDHKDAKTIRRWYDPTFFSCSLLLSQSEIDQIRALAPDVLRQPQSQNFPQEAEEFNITDLFSAPTL